MPHTELTLPKTSLPRDPLACCPAGTTEPPIGVHKALHTLPLPASPAPMPTGSPGSNHGFRFVLPTSLPASEPLPMLFPLTIHSSLNSSSFFSVWLNVASAGTSEVPGRQSHSSDTASEDPVPFPSFSINVLNQVIRCLTCQVPNLTPGCGGPCPAVPWIP